MVEPVDHNPIFKIAADFVNHTNRSIFLTGKAGSGKTTFLKHIVATTNKNCVVVAPTGVAAINAGGVTMHSFFQLPFGPFLPDVQKKFNGVEVSDAYRLFKNIRWAEDKRRLVNELELLIIDEVSMVRCDMLDAVDAVLRHFRKQPFKPFGGIQVLFIGDLYQLPPVAKAEEWEILKDYYESPFFFHSQAVLASPPLYIELKKIYRQRDEVFIELLNRVRNNQLREEDIDLLNGRFREGFRPEASENYITLCTHNYKADAVNATELAKLKGPVCRFKGSIQGEFSDKALPTEMELQLKEGAQIIFIKNDSDPERRYYNGRIAIVKSIEGEKIRVEFPDNKREITLDRETWQNIRYAYNREKESIEEEELGSFKQFPVRLAWAITIHKSQGLTFQKAIIDAGSSFAAGQVYVALSRCTTLEGLILYSRIHRSSISTDDRVIAFARKENEADALEGLFRAEQQRFWGAQLLDTFDFNKVISMLGDFVEKLPGRKIPDLAGAIALARAMLAGVNEKQEIANKFRHELGKLIEAIPEAGLGQLEARVKKAIDYFSAFFREDLIAPLQQHEAKVGKATKVKKYTHQLRAVKFEFVRQLKKLQEARFGDLVFHSVTENEKAEIEQLKKSTAPKKKKREPKGSSLKETLQMFRSGKRVAEIATIRELAASTIEGHLADLVKVGDLDIREMMNEERLKTITDALQQGDGSTLISVKLILGDDYTYGEIRAASNYREMMKQVEG